MHSLGALQRRTKVPRLLGRNRIVVRQLGICPGAPLDVVISQITTHQAEHRIGINVLAARGLILQPCGQVVHRHQLIQLAPLHLPINAHRPLSFLVVRRLTLRFLVTVLLVALFFIAQFAFFNSHFPPSRHSPRGVNASGSLSHFHMVSTGIPSSAHARA